MPRIEELVTLRPEVIEGDLHGIISLYALLDDDPDVFECDPQQVLDATYPSAVLKRLYEATYDPPIPACDVKLIAPATATTSLLTLNAKQSPSGGSS